MRHLLGVWWAAVLVQAAVWLLAGSLEFVGQLPLEVRLLDILEDLYSPAFRLVSAVVPKGWQTLGNVPLGLVAVGFSLCVYAVAIAGIALVVAWAAKKLFIRLTAAR